MQASTAGTRPLPRGSRARRLRASHSYGFVLVLILGSVVFAAAAPDDDWTESALLLTYCACLVGALWTSGVTRIGSIRTLVLAVGASVVAVAQLLTGGDWLSATVGLLTGALIFATIAVIVRGVADQASVNAQSVSGAICVYLLLGLLFTFLYGVIATLGDGAFFAQGADGTRSERVYFSYVTLATLGYGDYTPGNDLGRTLAVFEALAGQLYLVTVVALLVSRLARQTPAPVREDDLLPDERA